jgi:hypothetical protein
MARRTAVMRENLRPSGEAEPATSRMQPAVRNLHTTIGAHPPVDRAPTGVLETVDALTEPFSAFRISGRPAQKRRFLG